MRNKQKFLQIIQLLFVLCFSILSANASEYNLLKNSGFEAGKSNWEAYGSPISISTDSHSGAKAIKFHTGGTGQATDLLPNIDAIDGTAKYVVNGYYKHTGNVEGMWLGIVYFDSNWNTIGEDSIEVSKSTSYKKFEMTTTPPKGTNYMSFWAWTDGGTTLMDDIKLYPKLFNPNPCKLLQNGDFEKNIGGWSLYSSQTKHVNGGYQSSKAIQLHEGGIDQSIKIFNNNSHTFVFDGYYKTNGSPEGSWVGMEFYDKNNSLLTSKVIELKASNSYKKFSVNASSMKNIASIIVWFWTDADKKKGKLILDKLALTPSSCFSFTAPSSHPPKNMPISKSPQFVVLGFDDNTMSEGINWAINIFNNKKNHDQSDALASFYMNTAGLDTYIEDDPASLLTAMKTLKNTKHEMGNHTHDHQNGLSETQIIALNYTQWNKAFADCETKLKNPVGVLQNNIKGFRSPYLLYNQNTLNVAKNRNYLYDCSIEEGYAQQYNGKNFRWPYQLNEGSPGHNESWYGNPENPNSITIGSVIGLWELPVYVLMVPKDNQCATYGIQTGLWSRIKAKMTYLEDYKITSFDYNLWHLAELNKEEVLGILKYNLDLRLAGNRAPLTFGTHSQYYTDAWSQNAPNATTEQMKAAISEFVTYALSKQNVRVTTAENVIKWCQNPIALPNN